MDEPTIFERANVRRRGNFGRSADLIPGRCCADVPEGGRSPLFYQCKKKITVQRLVREPDGSTKEWGFCSTHDPDAEAMRREARQAKWKEENAARVLGWQRALKRPEEYADALRQIAAGHNDPRALAAEILAKWDDAQGIPTREGGDACGSVHR